MLHYTFLLAIFIVLIRPVKGEGFSWIPHPPPSFTTTKGTRRGASGDMKKEDWKHFDNTKPVARVVKKERIRPLEDEVLNPSKYPYASGAFGLEPELGIH